MRMSRGPVVQLEILELNAAWRYSPISGKRALRAPVVKEKDFNYVPEGEGEVCVSF
jgi:hypothetical protein